MQEAESSKIQPSLSTHRLPTISASQALQKLDELGDKWITTGLKRLDKDLRGTATIPPYASPRESTGGFTRGQITEIYGPPAAGKTGLALQATIECMRQGSHVVWIDANKPLHGPRLAAYLPQDSSRGELLSNFHHYTAPTLPHLLALICHPPALFPPPKTTLLILDGASSLFASAYPEQPNDMQRSRKKSEDATWSANRRYAVMADLLSKLARLAAIRDMAVVLVSQAGIKVRTELGAVLRPAIWTKSWSEGVHNRIVVFRDFFRGEDGASKRGVRFAAVVKVNGVGRARLETVVPFRIEEDGCRELDTGTAPPPPEVVAVPPTGAPQKKKRKLDEIADSQSEDSDEDLFNGLDLDADDAESDVVQVQVSFAQKDEEEDPDLARFEAAMEAGFDDA